MIFSKQTRSTAKIFFGTYEVETDVGILPFKEYVDEKGFFFSNAQK